MIIGGFSHQVPDVDPQETTEWPDSFDVVLETRGRSRARFSISQATTDEEFTLEDAECLVGHENAQYVTVDHRFLGPLGPEGFELIAEAVAAMEAEATVETMMHTIHAHPTLYEAVGEAFNAVYGLSINA